MSARETETALISTMDYKSKVEIAQSDGTGIVLTGPLVSQLYNAIAQDTAGKQALTLNLPNRSIMTNLKFTNLIVSEILSKGAVINGANDFSPKYIEIKNLTTNIIDIGGCNILVTNYNRLSEPVNYIISRGTTLAPGECYVIVSAVYVFSYYKRILEGFLFR